MNWFTNILGFGTPKPAPATEAPPVIVVPPGAAPAPTGIKIEGRAGAWGRWYSQTVPFESSSPVPAKQATGKAWYYVRITAGAKAALLDLSVSGPNRPAIRGASGNLLQPGQSVTLALYVGPLTVTKTSGWDQSNYGVWIGGMQIVKLSAQVLYGK